MGIFLPITFREIIWNPVGRGQGNARKPMGIDETKTLFPVIRKLGDIGDCSRMILVVHLFWNRFKTKATIHILYL